MSKLTKSIIGITTAIWLSGVLVLVPMTARAVTAAELQTQINALLAQIQTLQNQLATIQGTPTGYTFSVNLKIGSRGTDVTNLQTVLKSDSAIYPEGLVTGYFGSLTQAAVVKFQNKYASEILTPLGLTAGTGYVGASTRAKLNALYGGGIVTPVTPETPGVVTPAGTGLTLTSPTQPAASIAPGAAARIPFTTVTFTAGSDGDVVVTGVNVERTGLAVDAVFSGVVLLDENNLQLGIAKTFNSDHKLVVGESFTVKAGQSRTMTIAGNMASKTTLATYAGQIAYLSITGAVTSATVSGALPITGAGHTINGTLTIGSAAPARGVTDPGANQTSKEIGVTGYTFSAVRFTAGSNEKIRVKSVRWNQSGSAASSDLANVKTYIDGTAYDTVIDSTSKYYTSTFGDGIVVDKGNNVEVAIKGDITGGSARTIKFDVYKNTDVYIVGETYAFGITPTAGAVTTCTASVSQGSFCTTNPWYNAYTVTVSNGTINVQKATTVVAQNISINLANQPLGGFLVEVKGEPISVAQMIFNIQATGDEAENITNISLYDENGTVVAGPMDGASTATDSAHGTVTFTDTVTFPVGIHTYTLKGKLGTAFVSNDTIAASTTPSTNWTTVTGQTTGNTITPSPTSAVTANTMTVKATSLAISVSPDPIAQTVVSGGRFTFANYRFDASASGEDVKMASVPLAYYSAATPTNLSSCQLFDGPTAVTTGSNIINPTVAASSTAFTFDGVGLVITKGTIKTISLSCSMAAATTSGNIYFWGVDSGATFAGSGLTSGQSFTPTATDSQGQAITLGTGGTLTIALDSSSPSYAVAAAGTTGVTLGVLKFHAATEAITLQKVSLQLSGTASNSPQDLVKVTLWDGATQVGEAIFTTGDNATSTLTGSFVIPKDGDKLMTIKGDLAQVGISLPGTQGALIKVNYDGTDPTGTQGIGYNSGTTIDQGSSSDTAVSGVRVFRSYPIFTKLSGVSTTLVTGTGVDLYRFSMGASTGGNGIGVVQFTFSMATSTGNAVSGTTTVTNLKLYAYTDVTFSTPVSVFTNGLLNSTYTTLGTVATTTLTAAVLQIPAGTTYYFRLIGDVALTSGTGTFSGSVTTRLLGDSAYPILSTHMGAADTDNQIITGNTVDSKVIWSPNATTTAATSTVDWTNAYGVSTLPSSGLDAITISK